MASSTQGIDFVGSIESSPGTYSSVDLGGVDSLFSASLLQLDWTFIRVLDPFSQVSLPRLLHGNVRVSRETDTHLPGVARAVACFRGGRSLGCDVFGELPCVGRHLYFPGMVVLRACEELQPAGLSG